MCPVRLEAPRPKRPRRIDARPGIAHISHQHTSRETLGKCRHEMVRPARLVRLALADIVYIAVNL